MVFNVQDSDARNVVTDFPRDVEKIEHVWIPMSDGAKLAATIWLPKDAAENPVPAILEYIPYRKDDFTAIRDSIRHPYFAGHGYASIRVDIRGSGNSDGVLEDEYLKQEQDDALDVFDWIIKQPWSTGTIGMIGKSWGGFSGLQVAYRQHPALKTVITLCSTDDRFRDDVHYRGGNMLASDMLWWASTMLPYSARPQDPEVVGDGWLDNWKERLNTEPYIYKWLSHQRKDDYWKHGSISEDYSKVDIPVLAVSGWQDGYTDTVFRMVENLPQAKGIVGPWSHEYPEVANPQPSIGFLQEALRWWDQYLKGIDRGIDADPKIRAWIQNSELPKVNYDERPGKWVQETHWPTNNIEKETLWLADGKLQEEIPAKEQSIKVTSVQEHGLYAGVFCPFDEPGDLATDQRFEDGKSVVFTSDPFSEDVDLLGHPHVSLQFSSNRENALVAVRLCDKAPTGETTLLSWGMLNLNHLTSHEEPEALEVGQKYIAKIQLDSLGQQIPKGHRLEVAISPTYWPQAWPSPKPVTLEVYPGDATYISLPVRHKQASDGQELFEAPEIAPVIDREIVREESRTRDVNYDVISGEWTLTDLSDEGERILPMNGIRHGSINRNIFTIRSNDPLSATVECDWELVVAREGWETKLFTYSKMTSDETYFYVTNTVKALYNGEDFFSRTWSEKIKRDFQ